MQYKTILDTALRREEAVKQKLSETKTRLQTLQTLAKTAIKNATMATNVLRKKRALTGSAQGSLTARQSEAAELERASIRVRDIISALRKTAGKRREQSIQKQSNSFSSAW